MVHVHSLLLSHVHIVALGSALQALYMGLTLPYADNNHHMT
jgi:hypothetical protein